MDYKNDPVLKELINARVKLLLNKDLAFFGNLIARLELIENNTWCKTAATDGRRMYYNRDFIKSLKREELMFLMGHEVLHCVYDHLGRRGSRKPEIWNMANDYIVNWTLVKHHVGQMPSMGLYDAKYTDDMTSEEVYRLLEKNKVQIKATLDQHLENGGQEGQKKKGDGQDGSGQEKGDSPGDSDGEPDPNGTPGSGGGNREVTVDVYGEDGPPQLSEDEINEIRNDMMSAVLQIAQQVDAGTIPAGIRRLIKEFTEPKMNWKQMLEMHIQSSIKDDWTFLRPHRRSFSLGACLPGQNIQNRPEVMVWIDASGSISEEMLRDFLGEVVGIMETFPDFVMWLGTFDTRPYNVQKFTPENMDDVYTYDVGGGGGTDFLAMYQWMKENDDQWQNGAPEKIVCFTDGYPCGSWGDETYCPDVLWIIHYDANIIPPFGTGVLYNEDGHRGYRR